MNQTFYDPCSQLGLNTGNSALNVLGPLNGRFKMRRTLSNCRNVLMMPFVISCSRVYTMYHTFLIEWQVRKPNFSQGLQCFEDFLNSGYAAL